MSITSLTLVLHIVTHPRIWVRFYKATLDRIIGKSAREAPLALQIVWAYIAQHILYFQDTCIIAYIQTQL